ncbi:integral membrane protein [Mycobacterium triplex]|uniref:Integral membrane protein n=1 Tax=Mycobacterium triplex TaxID=47839 RepID=A0A024K320_9MYCO|nr:integral membrane protein [Mycobacterium triplex]
MPSWIALLLAVTATAIGYGIDSGLGHKELTGIFAGLYIAGCVAAVLAVRQEGLFTAVIQPPLILFCAVPGAYWLFHGGKIASLKDLLINCGYPLIERFPLMLGAAGGVLMIGLVRWYFGAPHRPEPATEDTATASPGVAEKSPFLRAVSAKLNALLGVASSDDHDADEQESTDSQRSPSRASARSSRTSRGSRPATSSGRSRSRHARPSPEEQYDPAAERPRRRRQSPPRDYDPADPPRRSRRPRPQTDPDRRSQPQREGRRDPRSRPDPYERSAPRAGRFDDYDRYERPGAARQFDRYQPYEPYESYQPSAEPRRRRANGSKGNDSTHHPISQVRYRGSGPSDEQRRGRPRANGRPPERPPADSWEYDA